MSRVQDSLIDALSYAGCSELPEEYNGEGIWIKALALVVRNNGDNSYVYLERQEDMSGRVVRDFGFGGSIFKVLKYYPLSYLKSEYIPEFSKERKSPRLDFLKKNKCDVSTLGDCTIKELDAIILGVAIRNQMKAERYNL